MNPERRHFLLSSTFAAAGLPVAASTVTTPTTGLREGMMELARPDGWRVPVYRAAPAQAAGPLPVVLLISEIFGLHAHMADVARRFAHAGYLCLAPDLFGRQGQAQAQTDVQVLLREIIAKVPDEQVLGDLDACVDWALREGGGAAQRVAVTGFCWGGRMTWMTAAHNPAIRAGVAWYGRLVGAASPLTPRHPIDVVGQLHAPVLGLYGGQDGGIPVSTVAQMQAALKTGNRAAQQSDFVLYRDAPHAFFADYRPSYRPADAQDAWGRCLGWFKQHGV